MALTLEEAKVGMADKVDQNVIDEFRRASILLDMLTFDDTVSPGTGGSTLTYGYVRLKTPSTVGTRTINTEYTPGEAKREEASAKVIILGGSFEIDRVIANTGGAVDEINFQIEQKSKAGANYFHNLVINGTSASSGTGYVTSTFDGLKKILSGTETEVTSTSDLSTSALVDSGYNAFLDELDAFLGMLDGKPDILMMNDKMLAKVRAAARRAGYYERNKNDFGTVVESYNGIPMLDMGKYYNGTKTVDVVEISTPSQSAYGETAIYAVKLGLDAFHGISVDGTNMLTTYLPDLKAPGAVKKGEVELLAGAVLKNSRKAGVLKGIKILPKTS
ncbi:major capsid protein [Lachnospiraceae bacterium LCP25S3_G4]